MNVLPAPVIGPLDEELELLDPQPAAATPMSPQTKMASRNLREITWMRLLRRVFAPQRSSAAPRACYRFVAGL
jgi:hypothetical protein